MSLHFCMCCVCVHALHSTWWCVVELGCMEVRIRDFVICVSLTDELLFIASLQQLLSGMVVVARWTARSLGMLVPRTPQLAQWHRLSHCQFVLLELLAVPVITQPSSRTTPRAVWDSSGQHMRTTKWEGVVFWSPFLPQHVLSSSSTLSPFNAMVPTYIAVIPNGAHSQFWGSSDLTRSTGRAWGSVWNCQTESLCTTIMM